MAFINSNKPLGAVLPGLPGHFEVQIYDDLQAKAQVPVNVDADDVSLSERGVNIDTLPIPCLSSIISFLTPRDFRAFLEVSKSIHPQLRHLFLQRWGAFSKVDSVMAFGLRHIGSMLPHTQYTCKYGFHQRYIDNIFKYKDSTIAELTKDVDAMLLACRGPEMESLEQIKEALSYECFNNDFEFMCFLLEQKDSSGICRDFKESKDKVLSALQGQYIDVSQVRLDSLLIDAQSLSYMTVLDCNHVQLLFVPSEIGRLTHLNRLWLVGNHLSSLPPQIAYLTALKDLNLASNHFTRFPEVIGDLVSLESLSLSCNQLTELSPVIGECRALKRLYLFENQLRSLPYQFEQMRNLQELNLYGNQFEIVPFPVLRLLNLEILDLSRNRLEILPKELSLLKNLRKLYVQENRLAYIYPKVILMKSLTFISVFEPHEINRELELARKYLKWYHRVPIGRRYYQFMEGEQERSLPVRLMREAFFTILDLIVAPNYD